MNLARKITQILFAAGFALSLNACLTSDGPKLYRSDLLQPPGLAGSYLATKVPPSRDPDEPSSVDAKLEAQGDGSFLMTFVEKDNSDSPVRLRLIALKPGAFLGVFTETESDSEAMYAFVSKGSGSDWSFQMTDLHRNSRTDALQALVKRHGAESISFEELGSTTTHDQIHGALDAGQLRMLFSDPDFLQMLETDSGFELTPK